MIKKLVGVLCLVFSDISFAQTTSPGAVGIVSAQNPPAATAVSPPTTSAVTVAPTAAPVTTATTTTAAPTAPAPSDIPDIAPVTTTASIPSAFYQAQADPSVTASGTEKAKAIDMNVCPPPSSYPLRPGYRFAGISPSCRGVQIPMFEN